MALYSQKLLTGNMTWVNQDNNVTNNIPDWHISIAFQGAAPFTKAEYLWGTGRCGNDIVHVAPIPGSLLLLGSALLGLVGVGWRKKS